MSSGVHKKNSTLFLYAPEYGLVHQYRENEFKKWKRKESTTTKPQLEVNFKFTTYDGMKNEFTISVRISLKMAKSVISK